MMQSIDIHSTSRDVGRSKFTTGELAMADESAGQFDVALPGGDVAMAARSAAFLQVY